MRGGGTIYGMHQVYFTHQYKNIISLENLLTSWRIFLKGKTKRADVQEFGLRLMPNLMSLQQDLSSRSYQHGGYGHFKINDPKPRDIHKASVRDRIVHHAVFRALYPFFNQIFIYDSYSCRLGKGTHKALRRFTSFSTWVEDCGYRTCFVLKCDIRKFFASIDQPILLSILEKHISDSDILRLLQNIIESFHSATLGVGLPLGNLTSQLLVNVYMNEFDQWVKHTQKVKYYIRYADDFVILHHSKAYLEDLIVKIGTFLSERLKLSLHPDKVFIKTLASGVDFLGWVHFPTHRVLRTTTKRRMFARCYDKPSTATIASYLGLLKHGEGYKLQQQITKKQR